MPCLTVDNNRWVGKSVRSQAPATDVSCTSCTWGCFCGLSRLQRISVLWTFPNSSWGWELIFAASLLRGVLQLNRMLSEEPYPFVCYSTHFTIKSFKSKSYEISEQTSFVIFNYRWICFNIQRRRSVNLTLRVWVLSVS